MRRGSIGRRSDRESRTMKRTGFALIGTAVVLATTPAHAALKTIEQAYELAASAVVLPAGATGSLLVRPCSGCQQEILQVTAATRCFIRPGSAAVSLADARKAAAKAADRRQASIFVYYDPKTRNVRRLVLEPGR